ncbi:MAG TPA: extracellular solute-binding protein, partial [Acidocella sp.]|nr:extracellular solute-binding protein [Acidocella sp.]
METLMRLKFLLTSACALGALTAAPSFAAETLTLYSAQHEQVVDMLASAFTRQTGIKVRVHEGEGPEIAAQLLQEGRDTPADVFFTENSPELNLLDEHALLAPVDKTILAAVPAAVARAAAMARTRWRAVCQGTSGSGRPTRTAKRAAT